MAVERIEIRPAGALHASIRPPGSKSITNRALVCAAMAEGCSTLNGALASEDTQVMIDALRQLGIPIRSAGAAEQSLLVDGRAGAWPTGAHRLFVANSGTAMRFLTAALATGRGEYRLDGEPRMRERPIRDLIQALAQLGADIRSESDNGCPPVRVCGQGLKGGQATVAGDISSQFLSGLLLAAPYAQSDVRLNVEGPLVSQPYIQMTLGVMRGFGVQVEAQELRQFHIRSGQSYRAVAYQIEPDASAASYFWAAAAITGGSVTVQGLGRDALQGDVAFCDCLRQMGCQVAFHPDSICVQGRALRGIDVNMNAISDTVQTLAAVALFAEGPTTVTGVGHIRHKETDRIGDLARELRKLGASVQELDDGLRITPGSLTAAEIETYHDHRMAMSLALVGLKVPGVVIRDPQCTRKTYPHFFRDLNSLG